MTTYIIRRLLQAVLVLILVTVFVFIAMRMLPGDPILIYLSGSETESMTAEQLTILKQQFGLDKSLPLQYINWLSGLFRGDFGTSIHYGESVARLLAERIPVTLHVGFISFFISSLFGILFGLIAALRRGTWLDNIVTALANFGVATPNFWLGILMIYLFGLYLGWLPTQGYISPFDDFWLSTRKLVMPVFVLATFSMAFLSRQTRSSILEVIRQDYVRTAWAKGLSERAVVIRHVMKNGLIPVITVMGMGLSHLIGGSVIVENVFGIPGMGRLMVSSVFGQDYQVVQACVLVIAIVVVFANLMVDVVYGWLDPRIKYG